MSVRTLTFADINILEINQIAARIEVRPATDDQTRIELSGPNDLVEATNITTEKLDCGTFLKIGSAKVLGMDMMFINQQGDTAAHRAGERASMLFTSNNEILPQVKIAVTTPVKTDIAVNICHGKVDVGRMQSDLHAYITGGTVVSADVVRGLNVQMLSDTGKISVGKVTRSAKLRVVGDAIIQIAAGTVNQLFAEVLGSGTINAKVTAQNARLRVLGSGSIGVRRVTGSLANHAPNTGRITVARRD